MRHPSHTPQTIPLSFAAPAVSWGIPDEVDTAAQVALATDRFAQGVLARATMGISPAALALAYTDWLMHLSVAPGKQVELVRKASRKWLRYANFVARAMQQEACPNCIEPLEQDTRFKAPAWQRWPYSAIHQAFLLHQQWWHNATTEVNGVSPHHEAIVSFCARQLLDAWSPSNFALTNPEVLDKAISSGGMNFIAGWKNLVEDSRRAVLGEPPAGAEAFAPGRQVAITPGKVVGRNRLMELIQYSPQTPKVHPEPILIVPAWIMKFYILDLSPQNSLVRYLVEQGHTVFMISWANPGPADANLSLDDYLRLGLFEALSMVERLVPNRQIHACGYCLGGTLLAIAAAALARDRDERLASITLLAAQVDFEEAGELMLFIDDSQVSLLEDMMAAQGFLDTRQMAGAFQVLHSSDLIWSNRLKEYLLGERSLMSDLMAWNADATRMPYRMHSQYLRELFLHNDLAEGRFHVDGRVVRLGDIQAPIFAVGTSRDHVAPWRSVYKLNLFTDTELTFLLASGGHNVGVVSPPSNPDVCAGYQFASRPRMGRYLDPDDWLQTAEHHEGSWWPVWVGWLQQRSGKPISPPAIRSVGAARRPLGDAPGTYVYRR